MRKEERIIFLGIRKNEPYNEPQIAYVFWK